MAPTGPESDSFGEPPRPLLPVSMLRQFVYCPRLFYLEWVHAEWADNFYTLDGSDAHRNVDQPTRRQPDPDNPEAIELRARSVSLSSPRLGLTGKLDVVDVGDDPRRVEPVEFKRGSPPTSGAEKSTPPQRIQVCAQALLLREHGFVCERGWIYFTEARQRVEVPIDAGLVSETLAALDEAHEVAARAALPPPLVDSPKCGGCSLNGICLPDEVNVLRGVSVYAPDQPVRQLFAANDDAAPLYVSTQGTRVGVSGDVLEVTDAKRKVLAVARFIDTSQVCVFGQVQVTTQAIRRLSERGIPVCWFSYGGWFYTRTETIGHKNVDLRIAQFATAADPKRALALAKRLVCTKILNGRTLLRRNTSGLEATLKELRHLARLAHRAPELPVLLGIEGLAARVYFGDFDKLLRSPKPGASGSGITFALEGRNRRPPKDPVNAMLSLAYALLAKDWTVTLAAVGLDPYVGFLHQPRYGRPALALDLMEEFRPLVAESVVVTAINTGVIGPEDFVSSPFGVNLKPHARSAFISAYEQRMAQEITHPILGYPITYRRLLELQARLLSRYLLGEIDVYPEIRTR